MTKKNLVLLKEDKPEFYAQLHPTKNDEEGIDTSALTMGSTLKVWWKCENGHEWQSKVAGRKGCPSCYRIRGGNIQDNSPYLLARWNHAKNEGIDPATVSLGSRMNLWWVCEKGHDVHNSPRSFVNKFKCDVCLKAKNLGQAKKYENLDNRLTNTHPEIAELWDEFRNGALTPMHVRSSRPGTFWWICVKGHAEEHTIRKMLGKREACSECKADNGYKTKKQLKAMQDLPAKPKFDRSLISKEAWDYIYCKDPAESIASLKPYVAERWHHTLNGPRTPENHSAKAHTWVWLRCDYNHANLFELNGSKETLEDCSDCTRSFFICRPELVEKYWDYERNVVSPKEILMEDRDTLIWWRCARNHCFQKSAVHMKDSKTKCIWCYNMDHRNLTNEVPEVAAEWHPTKNGDKEANTYTRGSDEKVWWQCSEGHEWQAFIKNRAIKRTSCVECRKNNR